MATYATGAVGVSDIKTTIVGMLLGDLCGGRSWRGGRKKQVCRYKKKKSAAVRQRLSVTREGKRRREEKEASCCCWNLCRISFFCRKEVKCELEDFVDPFFNAELLFYMRMISN